MNYNKIIKLINIFKKASEDEDSIAQQMESAEFFEDEMGKPSIEQNIVIEPEQKLTPIQAMEASLLAEANNKSTPMDRLVQITRMKKKFAVPAMLTFINQAERKQEPLFNYAKDMLYGRIPQHTEEFEKYMGLKKYLEQMSEDEIKEDPYNTVITAFTLWTKALNRAATRKFRGSKGKGRGQTYTPPVSLKHKTKERGQILRDDEAEPIFTSPVGEYSNRISRK